MKLQELLRYKKALFIGFSKYKKYFNGLNIDYCKYSDITEDLKVNNNLITSYSFILFGAISKSAPIALKVKNSLDKAGIPYLKYGEPESHKNDDKIYQAQHFKENNINHPKTIVSKKENINVNKLEHDLDFPIVVKIPNGSQGKGVIKLDNIIELNNFLSEKDDTTYIFQQFLQNDGDYRLFFFKDKFLYSIKRTSNNKLEFRNNTSLGGNQEFVELPKEALSFATKIVKQFNLDFSGVDLIFHNNKWKILEINAAPQFASSEEDTVKFKEKLVINEIVKYIKKYI